MRRESNRLKYGIFVNNDGSEPLNRSVDVGAANEYLSYVQDRMADGSLADLDPLNQLIMLEEMDEAEAQLLIADIYRKLKRKP